jgi:hypothetical protein
MGDKVQSTEDMSSVHEEHLEPTTDREGISSPAGFKFASPDVDVESSSSSPSGVAPPAAELSQRRKPSAVQAQEDLKAFARMHMVSRSCFVLFKCIYSNISSIPILIRNCTEGPEILLPEKEISMRRLGLIWNWLTTPRILKSEQPFPIPMTLVFHV